MMNQGSHKSLRWAFRSSNSDDGRLRPKAIVELPDSLPGSAERRFA